MARERILVAFADARHATVCFDGRTRVCSVDGFDDRRSQRRHRGITPCSGQAIRERARSRLGVLAQPHRTNVGWDDLVLPDRHARCYGAFATRSGYRDRVYEQWGFAGAARVGSESPHSLLGRREPVKRLAAEVVANELGLDLYRIDLSRFVDKYCSGKRKRTWRASSTRRTARASVLFFDEADALFGKRSEVRDSHDRYANIEIGYLLTRMEDYRGAAILATNFKQALDQAFIRRIRFHVDFPFPDAFGQRQQDMASYLSS